MLRSPVVILLIVIGAIAALFNRFVALLVYVWFALFRPAEWIWIDISGLRPSLILGLILLVPSLATGNLPNLTHPLSIGSVVFLATALIAQTNAVRPDIGWLWLDYLTRLILVCLLAIRLTNTPRRLFWLVGVTAVSIGFYGAKSGVVSVLGGGVKFSEGLAGAFIDSNGFALAIAMTIPFLVVTAQNIPSTFPLARWLRVGLLLSVPFCILTVIGTFSRSGFLAVISGLVVLVLLQRRRFVILIALTLLTLAIGPFVPLPSGYADRLRTIDVSESGEESAVSRLHFWRVARVMVNDNLLGVGLKNFEQRYDEYDSLNGQYGTKRAVHNSHFQVLAEQGYLGFIVWAGLFLYSISACVRIWIRCPRSDLTEEDNRFFKTYSGALLASIVAFLVGGSFIALALNDLTWLSFAFVAVLDRLYKARLLAAVGAAA